MATWTDERIEELKRRRHAGESFGQIARAMGLPRAAVSGKIDRLGLMCRSPRRLGYRKQSSRPALPRGGRTEVRSPPPPAPDLLRLVGGLDAPDESIGVAHEDLPRLSCQWSISGHGARMRCCARPVPDDGGLLFCLSHRAQAISAAPPAPHELARMERALIKAADRAGRERRPAAEPAEPTLDAALRRRVLA